MAKFKEFYKESLPTMFAKGVVGKMVAKKITGGILGKLGLNTKSLNILTGGKYFNWDNETKKKFQNDYSKYLRMNKDAIKGSEEEQTFKALSFFSKRNNELFKDNPFFKKGINISQFIRNLNIGSRIKGAYNSLSNTIDRHGSTALTILKALK